MGRHDEGYFPAKDALRLFWTSDVPDTEPKAHVAIVHGYGDHAGRYRGIIDALVQDGFAVHAFDYRGHGRADGKRAYAKAWSEFVDDLEVFWARVVAQAGGKQLFLLSHSHGGLMTAHFLKRHPAGLTGAIFASPYFELGLTPPLVKRIAARIGNVLLPWLPVPSGLSPADLTADPAMQAWTQADPLYLRDATPRWFVTSQAAQAESLSLAPLVTVPTLVLLAGKDRIARPAAGRAYFAAIAAKDKRLIEYPEMLHEPLNGLGREAVFRDISGWISTHL